MFHRPQLWSEIQSVINGVNAATYKTNISKEKTKLGKLLYAPKELNKAAKVAFKVHGWRVSKRAIGLPKTLR